MSPGEGILEIQAQRTARLPEWLVRLWLPATLSAAAATLILAVVVAASRSAWLLLGAGRGLVPEEYYYLSAFVLMLGTTFGQVLGWAGGSWILFYLMTRVGFEATWRTAGVAMSLVYLGLCGLHVFGYHLVYGQWLLRMPRQGIAQWLAANHPDAVWLLITAHGPVDWSLLPLGLGFLGLLWGCGERVRESLVLQTVLGLALFLTSLAIALSLGIHSTLVHIRL
jgi:hypothetical protein